MMSDIFTLGSKFLIGLACLVCMYFISGWKGFFKIPYSNFKRAGILSFIIIRLSFFILVFIILGIQPTSDVERWYYPQAKSVLAGMVPYNDFYSSYSIFFHYISSLPLLIWDSPAAIILFSILIECLALLVWLAIAKELFDENTQRLAALFYIFNPLPFFNVGISGQNQVWISFFCGLSLYLALKKKEISSLFFFIFSLLSTKILTVFYLPPIFLLIKRKIIWSLLLAVIVISVYFSFALKGIDLLCPLKNEITSKSSGNIPFLLSAVPKTLPLSYNRSFSVLLTVIFLLIIIAVFWNRFYRGEKEYLIHMLSAVFITFMLFSFKSYSNYLVICFYPICISIARSLKGGFKKEILLFGIFSIIVTLEPSAWHRLMATGDFSIIWKMHSYLFLKKALLFLLLEILLISFYIYYLVKILKLAFVSRTD